MTSWHRVYEEKRRLIVPLAIAAVANLLLYFIVVYPLTGRTASVEERAQTARVNAVAAERAFRAAEAARTGRSRADEQLARFYAEILPKDHAGARRITYSRLAQLADESNLEYDRRAQAVERERDSAVERLGMTLTLRGDYRDMRRFIHKLEAADEFVVIQDVALAQQERDAPLSLTLTLATYFHAQP